MQKRTVKIILAILSLMICAGGILAYLTATDKKVNTIGIHNNTIEIREEFEKPEPGKKTVKSPKAENTGTVDCYVRARVLLSDSRAASYIEYYNGNQLGWNMDDWEENEDGWLYYKYDLKVGKQTAPIFTHIKLLEELPEELKDVSIDVIFESVQSKTYSDKYEAFRSIEQEG